MVKKIVLVSMMVASFASQGFAQRSKWKMPEETIEQKAMLATSSKDLKTWMTYLTSPECRGRLTGDKGFYKAVDYATDLFKQWGLQPAGENGTYQQRFPHPYVMPQEGGFFTLHLPVGKGWVSKQYDYPDDYMVGGTSDTGFLKNLPLVYVGYGITAPELGYDSYKGVDVKGKIVVCERDVPYQGEDSRLQKAWMPYQYHNFKMTNAVKHGAAGMLYISTAGNPNPGYNKGFVYCCISDSVASDIFKADKKDHTTLKSNMNKTMKPNSFPLSSKADVKAITEWHPEGVGCNVVAVIPGTDPKLKDEYITIGAHIDHIGFQPLLCPGALDNASGSIIIMGVAKALGISGFKPKRTIVVTLFGGEETGLIGSDYMANHPIYPDKKHRLVINIDCLGDGYGLGAMVAKKYSSLFSYIKDANDKTVQRPLMLVPGRDEIVTRPRTDEANFFVKGIPTISPFAFGSKVKIPYHVPGDTMDYIDFDVSRDATKWATKLLMELSTADTLDISKN